ncbi:MAG: nucleotidyltransferase family protein [Acidimicrobiia bacterium]
MSPLPFLINEDELRSICLRYGIARLELFGSMVRGDATPQSDVDLLYELSPNATLGWEIDALEQELSELFGRSVDLVAKRALHRRLRARVLAEVVELYAA